MVDFASRVARVSDVFAVSVSQETDVKQVSVYTEVKREENIIYQPLI